jgi:superfamily II DNA or RNA helicase
LLKEPEILRHFGRKGVTLQAFLTNLPEELLLLQIRPHIDRITDRMLRIALQHDIPVFERDSSSRVYCENRLLISPEPSEPWFSFTKTETGSNYILELYQQEKLLRLKSPGNRIICRKPCWFKNEERLIHLPEGFDGKKIEPFLVKDSIFIPATAEKKYFETFILQTLKTGQVKASGFQVQELDIKPRMELSAEMDWQGNAVLIIWFRYGDKLILAGKAQKVFIDLKMDANSVVFYRTERDFARESGMIEKCASRGLYLVNGNMFSLPGNVVPGTVALYRLAEWMNQHVTFFRDEGIALRTDRSPLKFFTGHISVQIRVLPGADWFDISATVFFGELAVPFVELRHYIINEIREFPLPGGEVAVLPAEWFTRYSDLLYFSAITDRHFRLPLHHMQLIRELETTENQGLSTRLQTLSPDAIVPVDVPPLLQAVLRPYQTEGLHWLRFLYENSFGGCLADDMGLGKTIQTLALLLTFGDKQHPASLIVMPASLIHNWQNEIRKFAPSLRVMEHTGSERITVPDFFSSFDVILTTYGTLRNDLPLFLQYRFHYIILDESQMIKNPAALISRTVYQLKSDHRLVLTGTPIENSLTDLWSQFEFLNPGLLGPLSHFQKRFTAKWTGDTSDEANVSVSDRLKHIVAPFILRRTKKEAEPDLPPLTIEDLYCEMTHDQRSRYEAEKSAVRNEVLEKIESGSSAETSLMVLKALIRLRQMANHPKLTDPEYRHDSGKCDEIIRMSQILFQEGHKVLVFSSFVKHLQLIAGQLSAEKIPFSMLTGATVNREKVVRRFREDPLHQFFLISLKAGGTGLNLPEAGYVMLLDPWWNPAAEMQAINRVHRIGQDKKVIAYRFITSGTIEEKMLTLQERKRTLSDSFLPSGNPLKDLTQEEILGLLR